VSADDRVTVGAGDRVRIEYVGRFEDGTVFATSDPELAAERDLAAGGDPSPLVFTVGEGDVIPGLDEGVRGLAAGEAATIRVPPAEAYGPHREERVREYDRDSFEAMVGEPPAVGLHVEAQNDLHGDVTAVTGDTVEVDFNHELAGRTLVFELRVLDVS